jgi:hypothetical protein
MAVFYNLLLVNYLCKRSVNTKITLALRGALQLTTRINPGWKGYLTIPIYNAGSRTIVLRGQERFANVVFFRSSMAPEAPVREPISYARDFRPQDLEPQQMVSQLDHIRKLGPIFNILACLSKENHERIITISEEVESNLSEINKRIGEIEKRLEKVEDIPKFISDSMVEGLKKWYVEIEK